MDIRSGGRLPCTVCIITRNQADKLSCCLERLRQSDFAEEVVVLDTGSCDASK